MTSDEARAAFKRNLMFAVAADGAFMAVGVALTIMLGQSLYLIAAALVGSAPIAFVVITGRQFARNARAAAPAKDPLVE